ncbi:MULTISPECIES: glycosyltransferase [unclassified Aurantimonas]|uniref:glycosyltransferase n=1 Tax=unclassified Aurantimonas TaxID=2638230 RepID=UPI002E188D0C|nr:MULTISPECIES: glycosyltransferase [unclassified Aurantimonas]MEC5293723.1 glycosyltransferase [Aurantimonas sp. C2-3-R2]MEC5414773.1 glycosyltransferase [Aurantimonas sp. C2-4-R8]
MPAEFFPSHDPELDAYATSPRRDIDVLFVGGYSRHHQNRRYILDAVARLSGRLNIVFHLDNSRYTKLAETPLGWFGPLAAVRRSAAIRRVAVPSVAGRAMYEQLGRAKIVINAAVDMAGPDRGNMRCFEAMGAGAMLLTDAGNYPTGMNEGETMRVYGDVSEVPRLVDWGLQESNAQELGIRGSEMVRVRYSRRKQLENFVRIVKNL